MKKLLFTTLCLGTLMGIGNQSLAFANPIENESSDDINLFDVFENLMNDAMDKTRKEDLKKVFKLLKELNIDEEIIYQKVSETFAMTDETLKSVIK